LRLLAQWGNFQLPQLTNVHRLLKWWELMSWWSVVVQTQRIQLCKS
jgi:hypothetical protein